MRGDGVGVGDVGAVPGGAWCSGHTACGDDGGRAGGSMSEGYSVEAASMSVMLRGNRGGTGSASVTVHGSSLGLVALTALGRMGQTGCEGTEWESETSVRCLVGRGDPGHTAGGDDGGRADRERERHVLCGRGEHERDTGIEPGGDGVGVGDGARVGSGACCVDGAGTDGADGMRGDGVGVGDVGAVPDILWCRGTRRVAMTAGEQGGSLSRVMSFDAGSVSASRRIEPGGDGVGLCDGAWGRAGAGGVSRG
jgi:hypothetical protein